MACYAIPAMDVDVRLQRAPLAQFKRSMRLVAERAEHSPRTLGFRAAQAEIELKGDRGPIDLSVRRLKAGAFGHYPH
jgi:hypothetical protein